MAGWLATVSGAEEQTAGQIESNAARHQVFDVQVLPLVFLLRQRDLGAETPITCCSIHPWVIVQSLQQWQGTTLHKLHTAEGVKATLNIHSYLTQAANQRIKMAWFLSVSVCVYVCVISCGPRASEIYAVKNIQWVDVSMEAVVSHVAKWNRDQRSY